MFDQNEFKKYAVKHMGMSSMHLDNYMDKSTASVPNIQGFTPSVIEERQMNVGVFDVFSRLMMDRIIFMGVPVNSYVANVIQAQMLFLHFSVLGHLIQFVLKILKNFYALPGEF